jgi:hypothetical protein
MCYREILYKIKSARLYIQWHAKKIDLNCVCMYQQEMNIKANDVCKIAMNAFGKCVYSNLDSIITSGS